MMLPRNAWASTPVAFSHLWWKRSPKIHLANGGCIHCFSYLYHQLQSSWMNMRFILAHRHSLRWGRHSGRLLSDCRRGCINCLSRSQRNREGWDRKWCRVINLSHLNLTSSSETWLPNGSMISPNSTTSWGLNVQTCSELSETLHILSLPVDKCWNQESDS